MDDDQNAYTFVSTYGYLSTSFQRYMISVVVFFYKKTSKCVGVLHSYRYGLL